MKNLIFILLFILLNNCSFDSKSGIWKENEKEKERIAALEKKQKEVINVTKIYSSENMYSKEISLSVSIVLSDPKKNLSWEMSSLNYQNFLGNIYLTNTDNLFLKKKIGKNKFNISRNMSSPLIYNNNIILSDSTGTIFSVSSTGKIIWKKNIYKKIYKKVHKKLVFSIYKNNIYIADNIGFIYVISSDNGKLVWIKNHGIPFRSNIKIFENKIFLINQDNRLICLDTKDGFKIWDIRAISSFIKSQSLLSLAISKQGNIIAINSTGDLMKVGGKNGNLHWSLNTVGSMFANSTDFFKSSNIVITDKEIFFSAGSKFFSHNLDNGYINWENEVDSVGTPIINKKNIFFVTDNGFFVIINKDTGKIISSTNILKILKSKKQDTKVTGFIMGSGKIYSVTLNGYLIVSSAISGKAEYFKKIGDKIVSAPVINNGKLYILTENSKVIGFN